MRWPSVSLTFLKRSRSMNSTPTRRPLRLRLRDRLRQPLVQQQPVGQARSARRASPGTAAALPPGCATTRPARTTGSTRSGRRRRAAPSGTTRTRSCSPSLRWLRVRPVARGSSPLMSRATRPANAAAVVLVHQRVVGERHAEHLVGAPAEDVLRLRRPAHEAEVAVPLEHRERRVADVRREHPVGALAASSSLRFWSWMSACTA